MSTTTTEAEPDYLRQALAAEYAYGYITSMLDGDPDAATMRRDLRTVLARLRRDGVGEDQ